MSMSISIPFMKNGCSNGGHQEASQVFNEENWQAYF